MTIKRLSNGKTARYRRFNDRLTRGVVSGGGMLVLLALVVMFLYLLYAVLPLFQSPSLVALGGVAHNTMSGNTAEPAAFGVEGEWGFLIDGNGQGTLVSPRSPAPAPVDLMADFAGLAAASGGEPLFILANSQGGIRLTRPVFTTDPAKTAIWSFPFGREVRVLDDEHKPLRHLALSQPMGNGVTMAGQLASGQVVTARLGPQGFRRGEPLPAGNAIDQLLLSPDGRLLYALAANEVSIYLLSEEGPPLLRQRQSLAAAPVRIALLPADGSLLVREAGGRLSLWSDIAREDGHALARIREYSGRIKANAQILVSGQRPVFGVLDPDGALALFSIRQAAPRLRAHIIPGARATFGPVSDNEGGEADGGATEIVAVDSTGWRTLTQKVWYSHYPAPAWVWQSASANGRDGGKFSLVPLLAGTLKAAGYAMLIATPLALAAAIYTAWFMPPALRRWIKPAMEIMGAVPSVIIGLIAGLWLAPYYSRVLSGILLLPLVLPLVTLSVGWGIGRVSSGSAKSGAQAWSCLILVPPVALTVWLLCRVSPYIDNFLFGQPLSERLGDAYNPMNALVVGTAMGFALIPLMFTLAEDALFNVPARLVQGSLALGATPWQTLMGVTLPFASAGLFSALVLGLGRAIGETMIVLMASGNLPRVDGSLFQGLRALAANIAIEIPEAALNSAHYRILLLTALVLFIFTFLMNTLAESLRLRLRRHSRHQNGDAG